MLAALRRGAALPRRALSTTTEMHGTTILCVRRKGRVCLIGDGQVSMGTVSYTHLTLPTINWV